MVDALRELYQELIVDHGRHPRHFGQLENPTCTQEGHNPLCGDRVCVYFHVANHVIDEVSFEGTGCAIAMASASLMTEILRGKTVTEAMILFDAFHRMVTGQSPDQKKLVDLGKLRVLAGVAAYPVRVKCATLAWHTAKAALEGKAAVVSTEMAVK